MKHKNKEVPNELVNEVYNVRKLLGTCTWVIFVFVFIYVKLWDVACLFSFVSLFILAYDMFTAKTKFDRTLLSISYIALFCGANYAFGGLYLTKGLTDSNGTITTYKDAIYFSLITWTTVGYGDIQPSRDSRLWAASEAMFGYMYMALLIAFIVQLLNEKRMQVSENKNSDTPSDSA